MEKELNREVIYDGKIMQVTREEVELEEMCIRDRALYYVTPIHLP